MARRKYAKKYEFKTTRYTKRGARHTHFEDALVARRKYIKSGKYKGIHAKRRGYFLRHIKL